MNKNVMYMILLVQTLVFSIGPSNKNIFSYAGVKDEHKAHIEAGIEAIFPHQLMMTSVNPLLGGLSGDSLYVVEAKPYKYVFRCMKQPHSAKIYQKDCIYSELAAQKGLGPSVLYQNREAGCYATEFVEGVHLSSQHLEDTFVLEQFACALDVLHNAAVDSSIEFDIFERLEQKIESSIQKNPQFSIELNDCLYYLYRTKAAIKKHTIEQKTCHNDIHKMNLFYTPENTIQFIDWGNAGLGDPFWDLACSSIKLHFSKEQRDFFLEKYFHNEVSLVDRAHFILMENMVLLEVWLYYLGMKQNIAHQSAKDGVVSYFRKINEEIAAPINTFEDLATICFAFIQKRIQSQEYAEAFSLLEQL